MHNPVPVPFRQRGEKNSFKRIRMARTDLVGSDPDKVAVLVMQTDKLQILVAFENAMHVPEPS